MNLIRRSTFATVRSRDDVDVWIVRAAAWDEFLHLRVLSRECFLLSAAQSARVGARSDEVVAHWTLCERLLVLARVRLVGANIWSLGLNRSPALKALGVRHELRGSRLLLRPFSIGLVRPWARECFTDILTVTQIVNSFSLAQVSKRHFPLDDRIVRGGRWDLLCSILLYIRERLSIVTLHVVHHWFLPRERLVILCRVRLAS